MSDWIFSEMNECYIIKYMDEDGDMQYLCMGHDELDLPFWQGYDCKAPDNVLRFADRESAEYHVENMAYSLAFKPNKIKIIKLIKKR